MKKRYIFLIAFAFLFFYVVGINMIAQIMYETSKSYEVKQIYNDSSMNQLNFGGKAEVTVIRNRWYGKFVENHGANTNLTNLYLFSIIKLPVYINKINFMIIHYIVLIIFIFILLFSLIFFRHRYI